MSSMDENPFAEWIGRKSEAEDVVTPRLVASFRATFAHYLAAVGEGEAPLGIHWCLSPAIAPVEALGADGHPAKNRDLPPIPLPRRMWAGGRIESHGPIRVGDRVRRESTNGSIMRKQGRSGELWFVVMHHDYRTRRGLAIRERHDIVYREAAKPESSRSVERSDENAGFTDTIDGSWVVETTPTLLFRYSALTFNGHRIHYDQDYATREEGYPGLVVHGPLQATLLYNLAAASMGRTPRHFDYRGLSPAIAGNPIRARQSSKNGSQFITEGVSGTIHMEASLQEHGEGKSS
ncbi:FAS1-like dehydratase domain-containing protein [Mesorhizobium xinjiangense]|uniref:FAS1-like dehydratase domain-containing protein n=1 Tax=Mesorhizobium xinjiangense TaxID=2678685 RepID=UPI0012EE222F|nr:MaoC family dehydratase N-terminal domain-containing protein [Mesorhizobium xinjiangense]